MKFGRVRGIRAFFSCGPNRVNPFCLCWTNLQHWIYLKLEKKEVSLPLFISILRSSACHYQPQQFSDWVGQKTPGLPVVGRQGGISVNPPYSLLWEDDTHEAAHLMIISHNWAKELLVVRLPGERSSCLCCAILTDTDEKSSHHSQCCCHTQDCKDTTTTTNYGTVLSPKIFAGTRQFPG